MSEFLVSSVNIFVPFAIRVTIAARIMGGAAAKSRWSN